jgi:hypothetical protein
MALQTIRKLLYGEASKFHNSCVRRYHNIEWVINQMCFMMVKQKSANTMIWQRLSISIMTTAISAEHIDTMSNLKIGIAFVTS